MENWRTNELKNESFLLEQFKWLEKFLKKTKLTKKSVQVDSNKSQRERGEEGKQVLIDCMRHLVAFRKLFRK